MVNFAGIGLGVSGGWTAAIGRLFRMGDDIRHQVPVLGDDEIKSPIATNARLPEVRSLVKLLGTQRRVTQVFAQQVDLFIECLSHIGWGTLGRLESTRAEYDLHSALLNFAPRLLCFLFTDCTFHECP